MDNDKLFEKIESYLKGELSPEEMTAFENEIKDNPKLAEAVDQHRFEWDAMEVIIENDLRHQMSEWNAKNAPSTTPSVKEAKSSPFQGHQVAEKGRLYWRWGIAASLVLLIAVAIWFFKPSKSTVPDVVKTEVPSQPILSTDTIANRPPQYSGDKTDKKTDEEKEELVKPKNQAPNATNKEKDNTIYVVFATEAYVKSEVPSYEALQTTRNQSTKTSVLDQAVQAYDKKDFKKVITLLENTAYTDDNFIALEILGHTYFQTKNYKAALLVFQNLVKMSGRKSKEKSEWYLLLCYLADYQEHKKDFEAYSEKIINQPEHEYSKVTKKLKEDVKKNDPSVINGDNDDF